MERTEKFFQLATRVLAENGANVVKSYYCDGFERVPPPARCHRHRRRQEAAGGRGPDHGLPGHLRRRRGVDMGRNIFQSEHPAAMCRAVAKIVHEKFTDREAFQFYQELAAQDN